MLVEILQFNPWQRNKPSEASSKQQQSTANVCKKPRRSCNPAQRSARNTDLTAQFFHFSFSFFVRQLFPLKGNTMKATQHSALAIALFAALSAGQAMAAGNFPASGEFSSIEDTVVAAQPVTASVTRGQVQSEIVAMPASGEFSSGAASANAVQVASKTRTEVKSEIAALPASGEFSGVPQATVAVSAKTRAEVRAEVAEARRNGTLEINGDYRVN
jgi:hypothetical protein